MRRRPYFEVKTGLDGRPYWLLSTGAGKILCTSDPYPDDEACRKSIKEMRRALALARVIDRRRTP